MDGMQHRGTQNEPGASSIADSGSGTLFGSSRRGVTIEGSSSRHLMSFKDIPEDMLPQPDMYDESCAPTSEEIRKYSTKQSDQLSGWRWILLAKSLAIKTHENDKLVPGLMLYILTLFTGFSYAASKTWFCVYDIKSAETPSTVFTGTVDIAMALFWVSSGIYAHSLAGDLFSNPRFCNSVRMHSKMLFGVSALKLTLLLAIAAMVVDIWRNYENLSSSTCYKVSVTPIICKFMFISRVSFSFIACVWNLLCASVLFSVVRTHTIVLRRFIKELEKDGLLFELGWAKRREYQLTRQLHVTSISEGEYLWDDDISSFPSTFAESGKPSNTVLINIDHERGFPREARPSNQMLSTSYDSQRRLDLMDDPFMESAASRAQLMSNVSINSGDDESVTMPLEGPREPGMLSVNQILVSWWKLQCRLHISSLALQRWLFGWIVFITVISVHYIVMWLKQEPTVLEVFEFVIPILLLPLLCSAYAEVNYECSRVPRAIVPISERLPLLRQMLQQPLQLTMFGSPVNYSSIATVITAVGIAFATKIIFDEFSKSPL